MKLASKLKMVRLDSYFKQKMISSIDFIKTDIEEYDYLALVGCGDLLLNTKFIQFELGTGAPINGGVVGNKEYFNMFGNDFNLYILHDENHPIWIQSSLDCDLLILD